MQKKLTDGYVERLKPTPQVLRIWDVEVPTLGEKVKGLPSGSAPQVKEVGA